jgi:ribonuclease VapC
MVIDSSALVALLRKEAEATHFAEVIMTADFARISAPTLLETSMVLEGSGLSTEAGQRLDQLIGQLNLEITAFDEKMLPGARDAFRRFGKGRHPAALNFGDCISYATAKYFGEALLYKGSDFDLTDIRPAIPRLS